MAEVRITLETFLGHRLGKVFSDVVNDAGQPFDDALQFFNDECRQRRMEDAELHHDRAPLAGVVREFEAMPAIDHFFRKIHRRQTKRFRQAVGVVVRMIMERRGWRKTGRKGSLGVRAATDPQLPGHNTGGLAFWFLRAERYELIDGMPFQTVKEHCRELEAAKACEEAAAAPSRINGFSTSQ